MLIRGWLRSSIIDESTRRNMKIKKALKLKKAFSEALDQMQ